VIACLLATLPAVQFDNGRRSFSLGLALCSGGNASGSSTSAGLEVDACVLRLSWLRFEIGWNDSSCLKVLRYVPIAGSHIYVLVAKEASRQWTTLY
jgi:hypothetical protein